MSEAKNQNHEIILIADPRILAVSITDNGDELIDLKNQTEIVFGPSPEIPNNQDYTKMRKTVYEKLLQAQKMLPAGMRFCLYEAYRSLNLQKTLFENRYQHNKQIHPNWDHAQVFNESLKLVSPVTNLDGSKNFPPHSTGGAIDIYLIDEKGKPLEMGIHPKDWVDDDGTLALTHSPAISEQARKNREMMSKVLTAVGFINYPTEYWHWSYGDRYWAYHQTPHTHAIYGSVV